MQVGCESAQAIQDAVALTVIQENEEGMFGIGCDIESVGRFREVLGDPAFLNKVFTPRELKYCSGDRARAERLARIFACKEATYKALSSLGHKTLLNSIEIPEIKSEGNFILVKRSGGRGSYYKIFVSAACAGDVIIAASVAEVAKGRR